MVLGATDAIETLPHIAQFQFFGIDGDCLEASFEWLPYRVLFCNMDRTIVKIRGVSLCFLFTQDDDTLYSMTYNTRFTTKYYVSN